MVTGQADLVTAAQRRAVDARHHRHAQRLKLAQRTFGGERAFEYPSLFLHGRIQIHFQHGLDVAAGEELPGLAAAHVDAGDGILARDQVRHGLLHRLVVLLAHDVDLAVGLVEYQLDDTVGVLLQANIAH